MFRFSLQSSAANVYIKEPSKTNITILPNDDAQGIVFFSNVSQVSIKMSVIILVVLIVY